MVLSGWYYLLLGFVVDGGYGCCGVFYGVDVVVEAPGSHGIPGH